MKKRNLRLEYTTQLLKFEYVTPTTRVRTNSPSGSQTRDSGAGGGRSNKERQRLQPLASVARAPLLRSGEWGLHTALTGIHPLHSPPPLLRSGEWGLHTALTGIHPLHSPPPSFEVRGARFTHSPYWHTSVTLTPLNLTPVRSRHQCNPPSTTRVRTSSPSGSRTRDSGAGGGRSNKERQRLQPLASVARAPLLRSGEWGLHTALTGIHPLHSPPPSFEVRGARFTHSPYWHTSVTNRFLKH